VAHAYSLSTLVTYEPLVDSTTAVFLARLDELFADTYDVCDFGTWLQYFAFDVIGELTFSKRLGFLETGTDVENIMASIGANFDWFSVIGQWPVLDLWLGKNPMYNQLYRQSVSSPIVKFAQRRLAERLSPGEAENEDDGVLQDPEKQAQNTHSRPDFLSRFLSLSEENPEPLTDKQTIAHLFVGIALLTSLFPVLTRFLGEHQCRQRYHRYNSPRDILLPPQEPQIIAQTSCRTRRG
jgi:Cytochrome P450